MTSKEPQTQQKKEPNAIEASMACGCQPCTPRRASAGKRVPEQKAEAVGDRAGDAQSDMGTACCTICDCKKGEERPEWMAGMASWCGCGPTSAAKATPVPPIVKPQRPKGNAEPGPARKE